MSHPLTRFFLFVISVMLLLYGALWPAFALIVLASLFYNAYEYMFVAFCIDCYFAPDPFSLWYTMTVSILVVGSMVLRPYLRIGEQPE